MTIFGCPLNQAYGRVTKPKTKAPEPMPSDGMAQHAMVDNNKSQTVPRDAAINDENYKIILDSIKSLEEKYEASLKLSKQKLEESQKELKKYKESSVIEGFGNIHCDSQFNQLLLFIFTGMLLLILFDSMYKFGKKSF
jgi:hypothetical protein